MVLKYLMMPVLAAALAFPAAAAADDTGTTQQPAQTQQPEERQPAAERPGEQQRAEQRAEHKEHRVIRADGLIGQVVRDQQGDRSGRISDLALNVEEGRVAYVVVNRGGLWGVGGEEVALQWKAVQPEPQRGEVTIGEAEMRDARRIDTARGWPMEVGRDEPVGTAGEAVGTTGADAQKIVGMSNIIGSEIVNRQGERLGRVDDIALSRDGSVSYIVVAYGGFLGMGDSHTAIPWDRVDVNVQQENLTVDVTRQQFEAGRPFEGRDRETWPERVDWPFGTR